MRFINIIYELEQQPRDLKICSWPMWLLAIVEGGELVMTIVSLVRNSLNMWISLKISSMSQYKFTQNWLLAAFETDWEVTGDDRWVDRNEEIIQKYFKYPLKFVRNASDQPHRALLCRVSIEKLNKTISFTNSNIDLTALSNFFKLMFTIWSNTSSHKSTAYVLICSARARCVWLM